MFRILFRAESFKDQEKTYLLKAFLESVKKRSERGNTATLRYGRGWKIVPDRDRLKNREKRTDVDWMIQNVIERVT